MGWVESCATDDEGRRSWWKMGRKILYCVVIFGGVTGRKLYSTCPSFNTLTKKVSSEREKFPERQSLSGILASI